MKKIISISLLVLIANITFTQTEKPTYILPPNQVHNLQEELWTLSILFSCKKYII